MINYSNLILQTKLVIHYNYAIYVNYNPLASSWERTVNKLTIHFIETTFSTTLRKFMNEKGVDYLAIYNSRELLLHSHE